MTDLDVVDHALLRRVGDLQGRSASIEDGDPGLALTFERDLFGQSQHITVEGDRLVVVLRLDDETKLEHGPVSRYVAAHDVSRYGVGSDGVVELADGVRHPLVEADREQVVHRLVGGERGLDGHAGSAAGVFVDADANPHRRDVGVAEVELEATWRVDVDDTPPAGPPLALRPGDEERDAPAWRQVVLDDGGGMCRRAPPPFELARVCPQPPDALRGASSSVVMVIVRASASL